MISDGKLQLKEMSRPAKIGRHTIEKKLHSRIIDLKDELFEAKRMSRTIKSKSPSKSNELEELKAELKRKLAISKERNQCLQKLIENR